MSATTLKMERPVVCKASRADSRNVQELRALIPDEAELKQEIPKVKQIR